MASCPGMGWFRNRTVKSPDPLPGWIPVGGPALPANRVELFVRGSHICLKVADRAPTHAPFYLNLSADGDLLVVSHWLGPGSRVPRGSTLGKVQFLLPLECI